MDQTHIYLGVFALVFMCITGVSLILYFSFYDIQTDMPKPIPIKPVKPPPDQFPGQPQNLNMRYSRTKLY